MVFPCVDLPHLDYPCVDIPHVEGRKTPDSRSERRFPMRDIGIWQALQNRLQRKKRSKIDLYPDIKLPCLSTVRGKENRLFLRPFITVKETGGLDFLIVYAPLILCHSLFEVVIRFIMYNIRC